MKHRLFRSYKPDVLKKLQQEEKEVLLFFDSLCKENGWKYFLDYGALLGAVRHQGFIPWDDDIDVAMPRKDFEEMKQYMASHPELEYGYTDPLTDPKFSKYVPLFYRKGTIFQNDQIGTPPGIGIDIFVFDAVSTDPGKRKKDVNRANLQRRLHYLCYRDPLIPYEGILYYLIYAICKVARWGLKILRVDPVKLFRSFEKANRKSSRDYAASGWMITYFDADPNKNLIPETAFQTVDLTFEGHQLQTPADYDTLLCNLYGKDYMTLPPEEKRVNHSAMRICFGDGETVDYFAEK